MIEIVCRIFGHWWKHIPTDNPLLEAYRCRLCKCTCGLFKRNLSGKELVDTSRVDLIELAKQMVAEDTEENTEVIITAEIYGNLDRKTPRNDNVNH